MIAPMVDLLLIVPHPDDEVFGCGGLFSKMAAYGKRVATLTLTRGGAGRNLGLCQQKDLPEVREAELRASLAELGVKDIHIWDYPDYVPDDNRGMPRRNGLHDADPDEIVPRIRALIDELKPAAVITFAPNGSNGHPDHVYTHTFAIAAIDSAEHEPEALYYFASDRPYDGEEREGFMLPDKIAAFHVAPTHYVSIEGFIEPKLRAMGKHKTQALSVLMFMERLPRRILVESFHRARPVYPKGEGARTVMWL